ncbi:MAG: hypothetical protein LC635_05850, partial [Pseudonocardiaceae bacterium]|nr:hypothetical protein [Pseudonocardiaceae bacterium]
GARRRRNRRMGWVAGVLTTAAAAAAVTFVALPGQQETGGSPIAGDTKTSQESPGGTPPLALESGPGLGPQALSGVQGQEDFGPLEDEQGLFDCLSGQGVETGDLQVIGAREVTMDGTDGVAALLTPGANDHRFRLVIVEPSCAELITDTSLG